MPINRVTTNVVTGVGKPAPVLENQRIRRGPDEIPAPVSGVKTPGADIVATDREQRAAEALRDRVDLQQKIGMLFDRTA